MDMECTDKSMEPSIKENGSMKWCMAMEKNPGKMVATIKVTMKRIKSAD